MCDLSQVADEIIARLASLPGVDVRITVEIGSEHGEGFDDATVRALSENSRTLNFNSHGFEVGTNSSARNSSALSRCHSLVLPFLQSQAVNRVERCQSIGIR